MGRSWYIPNKDFEPDKSKWLTEGNPEEMSQKVNQSSHKGMTQWLYLFPWVCPVPSHMYYTCFLLINTYFTAFHLCGNFFLQSWSARALVTDHWSGAQDLVHSPLWSSPISGWEPKPCSKSLQVEATWDHISLIFFGKDSFIFWLLPHLIKVVSQSNLRGCLPDWNP